MPSDDACADGSRADGACSLYECLHTCSIDLASLEFATFGVLLAIADNLRFT